MFFHCDSPGYMVRQKTVEQLRRVANRNRDEITLRAHDFDEDYTFTWNEVTAQQVEKSIYVSLYVWFGAIAVQVIRSYLTDRNSDGHDTNAPNLCINTVLCGGYFAISEAGNGSHYSV